MTTQTASSASPGALAASVEATATASARPGAGDAIPASPAPPDCDDRAVRLALASGTANLRLQRVREVLDQCTPEDRRRILTALGDK